MKKLLFLSIFAISSAAFAQNKSIGIALASAVNPYRFVSGDETANGRFHVNPHATCGIAFLYRHRFSEKWSAVSGMNFSSTGYDFVLRDKTYSLLGRNSNDLYMNTSFATFDLPAMIEYHTKANCKNYRWIAGAGIRATFIGDAASSGYAESNTGTSVEKTLEVRSQTVANAALTGTMKIGREKYFKKGSAIEFGFHFTKGFSATSEANVTYQVDNITYNHTFSNKGDYAGLYFVYFFRPIGSKKLTTASN